MIETIELPMIALGLRMAALLADAQRLLQIVGDLQQPVQQRLLALGRLAAEIDAYWSERAFSTQPSAQVEASAAVVVDHLLQQATQLLHGELFALLSAQGTQLMPIVALSERQQIWLESYFLQYIYPLLTPLAVDSGRPFPYISSGSLNLLVLLHTELLSTQQHAEVAPRKMQQGPLFARVKVPRMIPRFIQVPTFTAPAGSAKQLLWSEDVVRHFARHLFPGMAVSGIYQFRLLRANEAIRSLNREINEDDALPTRAERDKAQPVVRLEAERAMPTAVLRWLTEHVQFSLPLVFRCTPPLRLSCLLELAEL